MPQNTKLHFLTTFLPGIDVSYYIKVFVRIVDTRFGTDRRLRGGAFLASQMLGLLVVYGLTLPAQLANLGTPVESIAPLIHATVFVIVA